MVEESSSMMMMMTMSKANYGNTPDPSIKLSSHIMKMKQVMKTPTGGNRGNSSKDMMGYQDRNLSACSGRKRRRASSFSFMVVFSLAAACSRCCWNMEHHHVEAFGVRKWVSRRIRITSRVPERFLADESKTDDASWSKPAQSSSPLQVRKRVKAVLEKARTRTGVDNSSVMARNVVADAASIGGFDDNVIIEVKNGAKRSNGAQRSIVFPDEELLVQRTNGTETNGAARTSKKDFDVIEGDVPAANTFCEPLPFKLPKLSVEQIRLLHAGERIQEQARMGREGSGYVVVDVKAPPYVIWESLLDFENYPEMISTVKEMQLYTSEKLNTGYVNEKPVGPGTGRETRHYGIPSITRASFVLSKFRLNIAAVHTYTPHPDGDYMIFNLDRSCTNMVLKGAKGIWHIQANPEGREGYTRVYLLCEVQISRALPSFIVDYAADRAMPRATTWLKPYVEHAAKQWLQS